MVGGASATRNHKHRLSSSLTATEKTCARNISPCGKSVNHREGVRKGFTAPCRGCHTQIMAGAAASRKLVPECGLNWKELQVGETCLQKADPQGVRYDLDEYGTIEDCKNSRWLPT